MDARSAKPWAIVLAGGEGSRLRGHRIRGEPLTSPKQFCTFREGGSLLQVTLARAQRVAARDRILSVVCESHRPWWEAQLRWKAPENVLAQPSNRGTAVAILHGLVHILSRDPDPRIVVLPCDHEVDDERILVATLHQAVRAAEDWPRHTVVLGFTPERAEPDFGWIVPERGEPGPTRSVRVFVEKPQRASALDLMRDGALWNSFILAGTGLGLLGLYEEAQPELLRIFARAMAEGGWSPEVLPALYRRLPALDFGLDVLQRTASRLRLLAAPSCGWTDLGTPARVEAWIETHRVRRGVPRARTKRPGSPAGAGLTLAAHET